MKRYIRSSLQRFTRAELQPRLEEAKLSVTCDVWAGALRRSLAFEDSYHSTDNMHDSIDPVSDTDYEVDLLLESDVD